jgi:hypothetical protein
VYTGAINALSYGIIRLVNPMKRPLYQRPWKNTSSGNSARFQAFQEIDSEAIFIAKVMSAARIAPPLMG